MASLLQVSAALARHATARARASPLAIGATSAALAVAPSPFVYSHGQRASIASTSVLAKRRGGNSAFVTKTPKFRGPRGPFKKKDALKANTAPHKTHLDRIRELKALGNENERNSAQWDELEADTELNAELDNVYEYLKNLGPEGEYIYRPDPTLADLDETEVLAKLNALARGDGDVLAEVQARLEEEGNDAAEQPHELGVDDYNFLMRVYAEKGLHEDAHALLTRMEKNLPSYITPVMDPTPASSTALATINGESLDAVPHAIAPDSKTYMYYVVSLVKAGAVGPAAAVRTLGRMKERGLEPTIHVYNSVMNVCAKAGKVQWAYNIFEKMQIAGLTPDRASFTILMHAAIAEGELDKAFKTFHLMRAHVTDPDAVAFTVLIQGYAKIGRIERAINLYEDLLDSRLTPTPMTFNALILACAKSHYYSHKAIEFYNEMQELYDYHPDLYTYNNVLHACSKHGDYISAERVWRQMLKHQVPLESHAFNTLLNVYARAQMKKIVAQAPRNKAPLPPPEEIYQEPLEFDEDGREIDLTRPFKETHSMENWNYDGEFEEDDEDDEDEEYGDEYDDDEAMEASRDRGLSASEQAALDAIRANDKKHVSLVPNMDPLTDNELDNTPMDLSNFSKFQTQIILRAENIYAEMTQEKQMPPSVVTLTSMLSVYANALRLNRAEAFFHDEFAKHNVQPNEHTYRTMMQMYVRAHRTPKAEALLAEIMTKINDGELRPDRITIGILVDHYARHKRLRKALTLLEKADEMHLRLEERHYRKIRRVTDKLGLFTELIPEDPDAVITAGTRGKLMEKRKVRAQVIAFNQKVGKKFLLPASVTE